MQYKEYNQKLFKIKRNLLQMSTRELAEMCQCTMQTIRNIENGRSNNKMAITFIGHTLDMIAQEKELYDVFKYVEEREIEDIIDFINA